MKTSLSAEQKQSTQLDHHYSDDEDDPSLTSQVAPTLWQLFTETEINESRAFDLWLPQWITSHHMSNTTEFQEICREILHLKKYQSLLDFVDQNSEHKPKHDYDFLVIEGLTAMKCGHLERSELNLKQAHHLRPLELIPILNLTKILMATQRFDLAYTWLNCGLDIDPNMMSLWKLCRELLVAEETPEEDMAAKMLALAQGKKSWLGESLACDMDLNNSLTSTDDNQLAQNQQEIFQKKVDRLEVFYHHGERDPDFLIEYTGALGGAGHYHKVIQIIWQTREPGVVFPLILSVHELQAHLALHKYQESLHLITQIRRHHMANLPADMAPLLDQYEEWIHSELKDSEAHVSKQPVTTS
ncbi:MAG: hypothetical protein OXC40_04900 [Proteobacteria bacterium]|nr:hypothetical protein [Pseudomonadota bacterium]